MDHAEAILTELRFAGAQAQRRTRWQQARRSREPRPEGEDEPSAAPPCCDAGGGAGGAVARRTKEPRLHAPR